MSKKLLSTNSESHCVATSIYSLLQSLEQISYQHLSDKFYEESTYFNLQASIHRNVDDIISLNVAISRIPGHSEGGDGRVGHTNATYSAQWH